MGSVIMIRLSTKLLEATAEMFASVEYMLSSKKRAQDFTRKRTMPFLSLVMFVLTQHSCTTAKALRTHFKNLLEDESMSQQAVSAARKKLTVRAFADLFKEATVIPMVEHSEKTWQGHFVYAIDGSKIALPSDPQLRSHYGTAGRGSKSPTAQASMCYDVLNDIILDTAIAPMTTDERTLAKDHVKNVEEFTQDKQKLFIYDRGYSSFEIIHQLEGIGAKYVMRVRKKFNLDIDAQETEDGLVILEKDGNSHTVRVIKLTLNSGEEEVLITNLMDESLTAEDFKVLYFMRWPVEIAYGIIKTKLEIENFSTRTVEGIQQDFYATMYLKNLLASMEFDLQEELKHKNETSTSKYEQRINKNELVGILKDDFIVALSEVISGASPTRMMKMLEEARKHLVPVRSNRSNPRNEPRKAKFHHNRKSNA